MKILELSVEEQQGLERLRFDADVTKVLELLNAEFAGAAQEARVVGGAVRNALMGMLPGDIDLATTAEPHQVMDRAKGAGFKAIGTGVDHGTVTVICEGRPFEVTTLREDIETDGRHAVVRYGRDWLRDAERRDFTMNALSLDKDGAVHDPIGGLADLRERRLHFIGDPESRIREDYLRILRFFRFHARFGEGAPGSDLLAMIAAQRDGLSRISAERIGKEMRGILEAVDPLSSLDAMQSIGLDEQIVGFGFDGAALQRALRAENAIADQLGYRLSDQWRSGIAMLRLAALLPAGHAFSDGAELRSRLRLSNAEQERFVQGINAMVQVREAKDDNLRRIQLYRLGRWAYLDAVVLLHAAGTLMPEEELWQLAGEARDWDAPQFPVSGATLMAFGHDSGPELGALIRKLEDSWIASDFTMSEPELLALGDLEVLRT